MVAPMLPLHTILEFEGVCRATRGHSLTGSFWAHLASAFYPGIQLPQARHGSDYARALKELLLLIPGVTFPGKPFRVETFEEITCLTKSLLRLKREVAQGLSRRPQRVSCDYVPIVV